jgi:RNA polymerase sigma-70 factor (ECF subfamily)
MMLSDHATAEEAVQEAFGRMWASTSTPSGQQEFKAWLYRVLTNLIRDHHRRRALERRLQFWMPQRAEDPIEWVGRREDHRELVSAMQKLKIIDQQTLYLRYFEDLSFADIAVVLGTSEGAARVAVHRALERLRRRWSGAQQLEASVS